MSTISELHNPILNPEFLERIHVVGTEEEEEDQPVEADGNENSGSE